MPFYEKAVRELPRLNNDGFIRRGKGDHNIWYSPVTKRHVTVDSKIKSRHTANAKPPVPLLMAKVMRPRWSQLYYSLDAHKDNSLISIIL